MLIAVGAGAIVFGTLGLALGWGSSNGGNRHSAAAFSAPRAAATPSASKTSEQPAAFVAAFVQALRSGDSTFLFDRLDPAVIARYGEQACRATVPGLFDSTAALTLRSTAGPRTFDYVSDNKSVAVPHVYTFTVDGVLGGQSATRHYHLALVDGRFRTFFDCGVPLPGAP